MRTRLALVATVTLALTVLAERSLGRLVFGPGGRLFLWTSDIWSDAMSQGIADPYSLSHVIHGLAFYWLLWLVASRTPLGSRAVAALVLEAVWEVLENSPIIIERYREATIALGYYGDSIVNSLGDIAMMAAGFLVASRLPVWASVSVVLGIELGMLVLIRDNLALNILMLLYPIDAVLDWQMQGASF
jgi:membrane-associated PAP2 superfamily phosphatase